MPSESTFKHSNGYIYTEAQARRHIHEWRHPIYCEVIPYESGVVLNDAQWKAETDAMLPRADALEAALNAFLEEAAHAPA